jgi:hypothetical protein
LELRLLPVVPRGQPRNSEATFGPLTPVMKLRPPMATTVSTPGVSSMICSIWRTTASVRSSDAASGSCTLTRR